MRVKYAGQEWNDKLKDGLHVNISSISQPRHSSGRNSEPLSAINITMIKNNSVLKYQMNAREFTLFKIITKISGK